MGFRLSYERFLELIIETNYLLIIFLIPVWFSYLFPTFNMFELGKLLVFPLMNIYRRKRYGAFNLLRSCIIMSSLLRSSGQTIIHRLQLMHCQAKFLMVFSFVPCCVATLSWSIVNVLV